MPLYTPKKVPLNWYQYEIKLLIELLKVYISNVENQIKSSVKQYNKKIEKGRVYKVIKVLNDEAPSDIIDTHEGLDSLTWDLEKIFKEYFPSLQRRSALITLFSVFEHTLNDLCILFQNTENYKIGFKDLKGKGIDRSIMYLELVSDIPIDKGNNIWERVKLIQNIRNIVVHNDGGLIKDDGTPKDEFKIVKQNNFLSGEKEVFVEEGYLNYVLESFNALFKYIDKLIQEKNG